MKLRRMIGVFGLIAVLAVAAHSQVAGAEYKGNKLCMGCHKKDGHITEAYPKTAHAHAMQEATDQTVVADFANAPFPRDQVAYVLGSGRHAQAYLDKDLKVLPGRWDVSEKKWIEEAAVDGATECVGCHVTNFDPEAKTWTALGVGCENCHGPGSKHITSKDKAATIVRPEELDPKKQAMVCGQCHSRGRTKDGKYAFPHGFLPGMDLSEVFVDAKPDTPGQNQQFSDLMQSPKHWENGIVCESCHDPHGDTAERFQLKMPINDTCLQCHKDDVQSIEAHVQAKGKTMRPGITCATCHMPNGRHLFDRTMADTAQ